MKSLAHVPSVICHLCQNSWEFLEKNGFLKFSAKWISNNSAAPITISIHPEKSVYICNGYRSTATHIHNPLYVVVSDHIPLTIIPTRSDMTIFLNSPQIILWQPKLIFLYERLCDWNSVSKSLYLLIGPTVNWGKKETNKKSFTGLRCALIFCQYTSNM